MNDKIFTSRGQTVRAASSEACNRINVRLTEWGEEWREREREREKTVQTVHSTVVITELTYRVPSQSP